MNARKRFRWRKPKTPRLVDYVEVLRLDPDDRLVLTVPNHLDAATVARIKDQMEDALDLPGRTVLVKTRDITFSILQPISDSESRT